MERGAVPRGALRGGREDAALPLSEAGPRWGRGRRALSRLRARTFSGASLGCGGDVSAEGGVGWGAGVSGRRPAAPSHLVSPSPWEYPLGALRGRSAHCVRLRGSPGTRVHEYLRKRKQPPLHSWVKPGAGGGSGFQPSSGTHNSIRVTLPKVRWRWVARQNQGGEFGTVPGLRESPTWVLEPLLLAKEPLRQGRDVEGTSRDPESVGTQGWDPRNCPARWNWKRRHRLDSSQGSLSDSLA